MDRLDLKIFLAMGARYYTFQGGVERQLNLSFIAKQLGVNPDTVRARIKKLEESGFIKYYQIFPNFRLFGMSCLATGLIFPNPASKKEALKKLKLINEVPWIDERLNSLRVLLLYQTLEPDLERKLALVEELTGVKPMRQNYMETLPVGMEPTLIDWLLFRSLRYDARKPTEQVAKELGLTARALNYRLQRLTRGNAYFIVPVISLENLQNTTCTHFTIFLDENRRAEAIDEITRLFGERDMSRYVSSEGSVTFCVLTTTITESDEDYLKVQAIPGVEKVIMDFTLRCHDTSGYIDKLMDERIMGLEKVVRPKPTPAAPSRAPKLVKQQPATRT
jgi:DNA-binding Lrp family transcriptional regulator